MNKHVILCHVICDQWYLRTFVYDKSQARESFTVNWISSKCRENFRCFCFICMERAKESHCSTEHAFVKKTFVIHRKSAKTVKLFFRLTFIIYGTMDNTIKLTLLIVVMIIVIIHKHIDILTYNNVIIWPVHIH